MNVEEVLQTAWTALEGGDTERAVKLATGLLDKEAVPEAHFLLALVARGEGDTESAQQQCTQALDLDSEYPDALLLSAEIAADHAEFEKAHEFATRALDAADEDDEFLNALLFKAELEAASDEPTRAAETLTELPPVDLEDADFHLRAAHIYFAIEDYVAAQKQFESALRLGSAAEAHHGLGLVAEIEGEKAAQIEHFKKVRELDLQAPRSSFSLTIEQIEELVDGALSELPPRAQSLLGNVPIVVEDYPTEALVLDGLDPRILGLFAGQPFPAESTLGPPPSLTQILLFQRNIERESTSMESAKDEILVTLLHEIGHFFGMDEEDLEELGLD